MEGSTLGGRERSSMTQHRGDFRLNSKHILALHAQTITYVSNFSSRFWLVHIKPKLFEVLLVNLRKMSKFETSCWTACRESHSSRLKTKVSLLSPCVFIIKAIKILSSRIIAPVRHFLRHWVTIYLLNSPCMQHRKRDSGRLQPVCSQFVPEWSITQLD